MKDLLRCEEGIKYMAQVKNVKIFNMFLLAKDSVVEILDILNIFYEATIDLQSPNVTLSDGHRIWLVSLLKLNKMRDNGSHKRTDLVAQLIKEMERRQKELMEYDAALAAQYLDPRFRSGLSVIHQQKAKTYILRIWDKISKDRANLDNASGSAHASKNDKENELLEAYYCAQESSDGPQRSNPIDNITENFHRLDREQRPSWKDFSIIAYWKQNKTINPECYEVSGYIYSIPATQVVVERSFSDLSYILSSRRCRLKQSTLDMILNLRLNKKIVFQIFKNDLDEIRKNTVIKRLKNRKKKFYLVKIKLNFFTNFSLIQCYERTNKTF